MDKKLKKNVRKNFVLKSVKKNYQKKLQKKFFEINCHKNFTKKKNAKLFKTYREFLQLKFTQKIGILRL